MKIQTVNIKSFKKLKDFKAEINGNNVFLMGENGEGKSTIIQAIKVALGDQSNIPPTGTGEWTVVTTKEDGTYQFRVKIKEGKSVVEVVAPNGMKDNKKYDKWTTFLEKYNEYFINLDNLWKKCFEELQTFVNIHKKPPSNISKNKADVYYLCS